MNKTLEKLNSARDSLGPILGRRRPTTEAELDECVQVLEELKRAVPRMRSEESALVVLASLDEVVSRIKNRPKGNP